MLDEVPLCDMCALRVAEAVIELPALYAGALYGNEAIVRRVRKASEARDRLASWRSRAKSFVRRDGDDLVVGMSVDPVGKYGTDVVIVRNDANVEPLKRILERWKRDDGSYEFSDEAITACLIAEAA